MSGVDGRAVVACVLQSSWILSVATTTRNVVAFGDEERDIEQDIGTQFGQIASWISPRLVLSRCVRVSAAPYVEKRHHGRRR